MAHVKADRVQQTTQHTGTGTLVLDGVVPTRMRSFIRHGGRLDVLVLIEHQSAAEWEISLATYNAGTITRVFATGAVSTTGGLVPFSGGTKTVSVIAPAYQAVEGDNNGDAVVRRDLVVTRNLLVGGTLGFALGQIYGDLSVIPAAGWSSGDVAHLYIGDTANGISAPWGGAVTLAGFYGVNLKGDGLVVPTAGWIAGQTARLNFGDSSNGFSAEYGGNATLSNFYGLKFGSNNTTRVQINQDGSAYFQGVGTTALSGERLPRQRFQPGQPTAALDLLHRLQKARRDPVSGVGR